MVKAGKDLKMECAPRKCFAISSLVFRHFNLLILGIFFVGLEHTPFGAILHVNVGSSQRTPRSFSPLPGSIVQSAFNLFPSKKIL